MGENQILETESDLIKPRSGFKKHFMTVTPVSKVLAGVIFVVLPFIGFWLGMQYQILSFQEQNVTDSPLLIRSQ